MTRHADFPCRAKVHFDDAGNAELIEFLLPRPYGQHDGVIDLAVVRVADLGPEQIRALGVELRKVEDAEKRWRETVARAEKRYPRDPYELDDDAHVRDQDHRDHEMGLM